MPPRKKRKVLSRLSRIEYVLVIGALFALAVVVGVEGFNLSFQAGGTTVALLAPADGASVSGTGLLRLRVLTEGASPFYSLSIYLKRGGMPGLNDKIVTAKVDAGKTFTYAIDPTHYEGGTYTWYAAAVDAGGNSVDSESARFTLPSVSSGGNENGSNSTGSNANETSDSGLIGSCTGGPGGHASDPTGEKTFFYPAISAYGARDLTFNKANLHSIEKIHLRALDIPLKPNGIIIHQELKKIKRLPGVADLYKVYDLQTTSAWPEDRFYLTIYFRFPKDRLTANGYTPHHVALHEYRNDAWSPRPTSLVREELDYYVFESTLLGNPPFATGACPFTYDGYPAGSPLPGDASS